KEARLYKQPGATETAAMKSAEGNVQEKNYEATFPVMYNILGQHTIAAAASAIGPANITPSIPINIGKITINGIKNKI
ncbi:hypothetical protein ACTPD5_22345, partial [Clostridioides difficile]|uniref:hypothetical protein n=1 Tax=Clostridioides difficile TaxID=1496 RepID=UPI003F8D167D